jgi:hypothetical protein
MTEEVIVPVEEVVVPVDLDSNPPDGTVGRDHEGFVAPKDEELAAEVVPEDAPQADPPAEGEEESPAEESNNDTPLDTSVWGDTGSEVGNSVLGMLQDSGLSTEEAKALLYDGISSGDASKIDMEALTAKVGKNAANIIVSGAKSFIAENAEKNTAIISEVHTTAGSKENWDAVSKWAVDNVSESDLEEYRPMIDKGGAAARFAVSELMSSYNKDSNNSTISATTPRAEATSVSPPASTAISRAEYVAALTKAHRNGASPKEIATIQANRNNGRKRGI